MATRGASGAGLAVLATVLFAGLLSSANPDDLPASGTVTIESPVAKAAEDLIKCREAAKGVLEMSACYEAAVAVHPGNFTWQASLALLLLRADRVGRAKIAMNRSASAFIVHMTPQLEANGTNMSNTTYLVLLRKSYEIARDNNDSLALDAVVEQGLLLAKKFEIDHQVGDAHSIYYGFVMQASSQGDSHLLDFHRRTGNIVALIHLGQSNESSLAFRIAESVPSIIDGLIQHVMSHGPMTEPIRRMCGIEITQNDELRLTTLVNNLMECIENWGNYSQSLEAEGLVADTALAPFGKLRATTLHRLAALGLTSVLKETMEHFGSRTIPADRPGRGLLHYAAAGGHADTVKMLVESGARYDKEDAGRIQPAHLGCAHKHFREDFEKAVGSSTACMGIMRNRHEDPDIEVTDDSGTDGGWNPKKKRPTYLHCDIDVRDASKMTSQDLLLNYALSGIPVVLRNAFFDTDGPDDGWRHKAFVRKFGSLLARQEVTPTGERFGIGSAAVTTIGAFLNTTATNDGTNANLRVDFQTHPLYELASWHSKAFTKKKDALEELFFSLDEASPLVVINKAGSKSHHHIRPFMTTHTIVYGHLDFQLLPPAFARTVRGQLEGTAASQATRCSLYTGDVLFLPEMWSASWVSQANGVLIENVVHRAGTGPSSS